jgi:dienelactone hydrolase
MSDKRACWTPQARRVRCRANGDGGVVGPCARRATLRRWAMPMFELVLALSSVVAVAQAGDARSVTKITTSVTLPDRPSSAYAVDVYRPTGVPPFPVVGLGHGFQNSKGNYEALSRELAAAGVLVVVPQLPLGGFLEFGWNDHARNALILLAAVDAQIASGVADPSRIALGGHSAGGLSAWLAAAQRQDLRALVLLDAVDAEGLGLPHAGQVLAPTLFTFASPGLCNSNTNSTAWYPNKRGPKARLNVVGSGHCDPQEPANFFCASGCNLYNPTKAAVFKRYAVAFFGRYLLGFDGLAFEAMTRADLTDTTIVGLELQLGAETPTADAGVGSANADAGTAHVDGSAAAEDGGRRELPDGGSEAPTGADGDSASGGPPAQLHVGAQGCACASETWPPLGWLAALLCCRRRSRADGTTHRR